MFIHPTYMVFLVLSHGKTIHVGRINLEPYLPLDDVQIVVVHLAKGILLLCQRNPAVQVDKRDWKLEERNAKKSRLKSHRSKIIRSSAKTELEPSQATAFHI